MQRLVLDVAARVIRASDREHPADAVLRSELRNARQLTPAQRTEISAAVFTYYRWFGWLDKHAPLREQIAHARTLAESFETGSKQFSDEELVSRALPMWLPQFMEITPAFARAIQYPPRLWLRARKGQAAQLAQRLGNSKISTDVPDALVYLGTEDLFQRPEFKQGEFEIQDISSQIIGRIANPQPGETWWDACAGEGGKTLHLSDLMENKGLIWASDRAAWRLDKLKRRTARARVFNYRAAVWDGSSKLPTRTKFDGVLVDAPCTGVGTWQRNPQARWTITTQDVEELAALQRQLLSNVTPSVKPGGKLIYAVCTLMPHETTAIAKWITDSHPEFACSPATLLRPEETGGNGMFISVWQRR
ncbi:MAG TPA: RsmB/NOP family class I SAM-dependent RNA methyltransferase [Candidatus Binatia bacterium]|nr:RsmB/NOP family class I SAM-dependent RNA methyltransferase [Candidatus Binatia bacterium]